MPPPHRQRANAVCRRSNIHEINQELQLARLQAVAVASIWLACKVDEVGGSGTVAAGDDPFPERDRGSLTALVRAGIALAAAPPPRAEASPAENGAAAGAGEAAGASATGRSPDARASTSPAITSSTSVKTSPAQGSANGKAAPPVRAQGLAAWLA